jgi:hypothetical protein
MYDKQNDPDYIHVLCNNCKRNGKDHDCVDACVKSGRKLYKPIKKDFPYNGNYFFITTKEQSLFVDLLKNMECQCNLIKEHDPDCIHAEFIKDGVFKLVDMLITIAGRPIDKKQVTELEKYYEQFNKELDAALRGD